MLIKLILKPTRLKSKMFGLERLWTLDFETGFWSLPLRDRAKCGVVGRLGLIEGEILGLR